MTGDSIRVGRGTHGRTDTSTFTVSSSQVTDEDKDNDDEDTSSSFTALSKNITLLYKLFLSHSDLSAEHPDSAGFPDWREAKNSRIYISNLV